MNKRITLVLLASLLFQIILSSNVLAQSGNADYLDVVLLNQDPDPAQPGNYIELRWKIEKFGDGELEDIVFELDAKYPFLFDSSDTSTKSFGDWSYWSDKDEYLILYYKLRVDDNALKGDYDLTLKYSVTDDSGREVMLSKEFTVRVGDSKDAELVIGSIKSSPVKILPDSDENELNVEILNVGEGKAENVIAELVLLEGFENTYSYSNRQSLGNIAAGTGETATFYLDVAETVSAGSYPTKILIKYKNGDSFDDSLNEIEIKFDLEVKDKPTFELGTPVYDKENIVGGDAVSIKLPLKNLGLQKSESVSIRAFKESTQPFSFDEKSDFIGTLSAGEEGAGVLKINVDKGADTKKYFIDVEIRSVRNGQVFIQEETIPLQINAREGGLFSSPIFMTIIIVVVLVGLLYGAYLYGKGSALVKKK